MNSQPSFTTSGESSSTTPGESMATTPGEPIATTPGESNSTTPGEPASAISGSMNTGNSVFTFTSREVDLHRQLESLHSELKTKELESERWRKDFRLACIKVAMLEEKLAIEKRISERLGHELSVCKNNRDMAEKHRDQLLVEVAQRKAMTLFTTDFVPPPYHTPYRPD